MRTTHARFVPVRVTRVAVRKKRWCLYRASLVAHRVCILYLSRDRQTAGERECDTLGFRYRTLLTKPSKIFKYLEYTIVQSRLDQPTRNRRSMPKSHTDKDQTQKYHTRKVLIFACGCFIYGTIYYLRIY